MRRRLTGPLSLRFFDRPGNQPVPPMLIEANRFFAMGNYAEAAGRYEKLAHMSATNRPRLSARMLVEAGRAQLLAGQEHQATELIQRGLAMLAAQQRWVALGLLGASITQLLQARGLSPQAEEVSAWVNKQRAAAPKGAVPDGGAQQATAPDDAAARLPSRCPSCEAPVVAREMEWLDPASAECGYCGSLVRAEKG